MHTLTTRKRPMVRLHWLALHGLLATVAITGECKAQSLPKPGLELSSPFAIEQDPIPAEKPPAPTRPIYVGSRRIADIQQPVPASFLMHDESEGTAPASAISEDAVIAAANGQGHSPKPGIKQNATLAIEADKALLVQLREPAKTVFIANPEIADIQVPTPNSFLLYGKKAGATTVFAISEDGNTTSYSVRVTRPAGEIGAAVHNAVPGAQVKVSATPDGVTISGTVNSPRDAERLKAAAREYLGDKETINFDVAVNAATQVTLRVRVAEVSRNVDKQLGVNWEGLFNNGTLAVGLLTGRTAATSFGNFVAPTSTNTFGSVGLGYKSPGGSVNVSTLVDALDRDGLATILAEPTLTAVSGETANFLAGGEYPIPVPQGNQIVTIDYKRYGISVDFTPTVLDGNRISVKVRPEVSALTSVGAVTIDNISVPALTVRRAETTVELGSGESFAIAGLFQNNSQNQTQGLPWMADVPILGALFRSTSFQRNESELVIIVTPFIVKPASQTTDLQLPTDGLQFSSDIERILRGRLTASDPRATTPSSPTPGTPRLRGPAGFMME